VNDRDDVVRVKVWVSFGSEAREDTVSVARAFWRGLTPWQRRNLCLDEAVDLRESELSLGFEVLDEDSIDDETVPRGSER
jgi:hypothetical protein